MLLLLLLLALAGPQCCAHATCWLVWLRTCYGIIWLDVERNAAAAAVTMVTARMVKETAAMMMIQSLAFN